MFIIAAQGGQARELTQSGCSELDANWSFDGTHVIFGDFPAFPGVSPGWPAIHGFEDSRNLHGAWLAGAVSAAIVPGRQEMLSRLLE
jgi:hypothetical protein